MKGHGILQTAELLLVTMCILLISTSGIRTANAAPALPTTEARIQFYMSETDAEPVSSCTTLDQAISVAIDSRWIGRGVHSADLSIFAPDGMLYNEILVDFTVLKDDGTHVSASRTDDRWWRVWYVMPIGGTPIRYYGLTGTWIFQLVLDGDAETATTASLEME